jgi:hypothetical protein
VWVLHCKGGYEVFQGKSSTGWTAQAGMGYLQYP